MENNTWLTDKELMERWEINAPNLSQLILDKKIKPVWIKEPPWEYDWMNKADMRDRVKSTRRGWRVCDEYDLTLGSIIQFLDKAIFSIEDVITYEIENGLEVTRNQGKAISDQPEQERAKNFFVNKGDVWEIGFQEDKQSKTIKNTDGMTYIAILLQPRGVPIPATELYNALKCNMVENPESQPEEEQIFQKSNYDDFSPQVKTSRVEQIKQAEIGLADAKRSGDPRLIKEETENFNDLMEKIKKEKYQLNSRVEKERINISQRIKTAIKKIEKGGLKNLSKHLSRDLTLGTSCLYNPEKNIEEWHIELKN